MSNYKLMDLYANGSIYQKAIYDFVANPTAGNLMVDAKAGSGKTTTATRAQIVMNECYPNQTIAFLAFNKSIATELKSRGLNGMTFHSACFSPVLRHKGARNVDTNKMWALSKDKFSSEDFYRYGAFCRKLAGLAKQEGIGCLVPDMPEEYQAIVDKHDMTIEEPATMERAIELTQKLMELSYASHMVDFDDLLYIAVRDNVSLTRYNWLIVDESQDTNRIQRALIRKMLMIFPSGRLMAIGDPGQSIYGFRGADSDSMERIREDFDCTVLPLSISYRCSKNVVNYAQRWVPEIEAAETAPEGQVIDCQDGNESFHVGMLEPSDLVICRTSAPLVSLGLRMLANRIPVRIMGRGFGDDLAKLVKQLGKTKAKSLDDSAWSTNDIEQLQLNLDSWKAREMQTAIENGKDDKAELICDKADALYALIDSMPEDDRSIGGLLAVLADLFDESKQATTLATIHKSKGLEADRVVWLGRELCPSRWAKQDWQRQQERNLCYVAATRAKSTLVLMPAKIPANKEKA